MENLYGNRHYQQIPEPQNYNQNYSQNYNLKPIPYAETASVQSYGNDPYRPVSPQPYAGGATLERLSTQDDTIKYRIRMLRIVSRVLAAITSGATVAPLAMTLIKFFQTRNQIITVDGEQRTAWASGTIAWYTYLYFGVSTVSFILNAVILISYCGGVKKANKASSYAGWWTGLLMVGHIIIWGVSIGIYRYGKEPVEDGRFTDLWGWTCSTAADEIQSQVTNIDYSQYCTAQTSSFYTGIVQVVTSLLSAGIYFMVFMRMRSKKQMKKASIRVSQSAEPLRQ